MIALAACQAPSTPTATQAVPTSSPVPTAGSTAPAVATVSPTPTPTSAAAEARAVVDGLRAFAADASRTFRVTFTGVSRHTVDMLEVEGTLDVAGEDALLAAGFTFPRGMGSVDYRRIGTEDWVRFDRGRWIALEGPDVRTVVDVFAGTHDGSRVQYLGPVAGEPGRFQVELASVILHPALIPAGNLADERATRTRLLLVTDGSGRPVSGTWTMRGQGRVSGQLQEIAIDLELAFSRLGEPVRIDAP